MAGVVGVGKVDSNKVVVPAQPVDEMDDMEKRMAALNAI